MLVLAGNGLVDLAHLQVSILELDPPQAVLNLHLDGPILHVFQVPVLDPVLVDGLVAI